MAHTNNSHWALVAALIIIALTAFTVDAILAEGKNTAIKFSPPLHPEAQEDEGEVSETLDDITGMIIG